MAYVVTLSGAVMKRMLLSKAPPQHSTACIIQIALLSVYHVVNGRRALRNW